MSLTDQSFLHDLLVELAAAREAQTKAYGALAAIEQPLKAQLAEATATAREAFTVAQALEAELYLMAKEEYVRLQAARKAALVAGQACPLVTTPGWTVKTLTPPVIEREDLLPRAALKPDMAAVKKLLKDGPVAGVTVQQVPSFVMAAKASKE